MLDDEKRQAIAAYKERQTVAGIYALRCLASGEVWVGPSANLETLQNRLWFTLRLDTNPHRTLQEAWATHGEAHFRFEALERLDEKDVGPLQATLLKKRADHWRSTLGANKL